MSEQSSAEAQLDFATARSTYRIIHALLEHVSASADLIALMASVLGEEPTRSITQSVAWAEFLTARRNMEAMQPELQRFVDTVTKIIAAQPETPASEPATTSAEKTSEVTDQSEK